MKQEADVVWVLDMMKEMGVSQHNMASCSLTGAGDLLFVCTSNGVDVEHNYIPAAGCAQLLRDGQEHARRFSGPTNRPA